MAALAFVLPANAQRLGIVNKDASFRPGYLQALEWRNIGPFRGGRSVAVAGHPDHPLTYYMGSTGGGLWKTEDAGLTWNNISDGFFNSGSIGAIAIAPSDPNVIYVGTGEHAVRGVMSTQGDGVYKSTDGGQTWIDMGLTLTRHIAEIKIHPRNPDMVYVAAQGAQYGPSKERGVFKSDNGGLTWRRVLFINETTGACDLSMDPTNPRILYAGVWDHRRKPWVMRSGGPGSGLYKSTDAGESWKKLCTGLPQKMGKVGVSVSPANPQRVYANIEAEHGGVFRSDDGGATWVQTSKDRRTVGRAWYYTELEADPADPETVYVLNAPFLRSVDGGKHFEAIASPHSDQHDLWINPDHPRTMILANDGGACITFNGGQSWSSQQNQPTGQFYRVNTDNRFPYFVYGGQQDNSSIAIASQTISQGIGPRDWYPVAGCESAFLAFDPEDPELIYGSCYQGYIERFDQQTRTRKDIMAYPAIGLATPPREMRWRFNWNAPLVVSPHDSEVIYHAANAVLRSNDRGLSWQAISPDLTRNEPEKQGPGGVPFTNEGAGGANYNTISYLSCSPHTEGVLWAGTDDGLLHLSRNGGDSWTEITPEGLGEARINAIELSPHRPGKAYLVATRHQFNDLRPLIFYTEDYGQKWKPVTRGIAATHFARVVREDPKREGLLYAGTEKGLYISFNGGKQWRPFQLNLPVCPVTDLKFQGNDLVASTMGRGFWILDDLNAIQGSMGYFPDQRAVLYPPTSTVKLQTETPPQPVPGLGQNPPDGIIIDYYLPRKMDSLELQLEIIDKNGRVLRTYSNLAKPRKQPYPGGPKPEALLPAKEGINRFHWDFRRDPLPGIPGVYIYGDYRSGTVAPGLYTARLTGMGQELEQTFELLPDPRLDAKYEDYREQELVMISLESTVREIHRSVKHMWEVKKQISFLTEQMRKAGCTEDLIRRGERILNKIREWERALIQPRQKTGQDVINFENKLSAEFLDLLHRIDSHNPVVTQGARKRMDDLLGQWSTLRAKMREIVEEDVPEFNRTYKEQDLPIVVIPSSAD